MSALIISGIIIVLLSIVVYIIVAIVYSPSNLGKDLAPSALNLNKQSNVLDSASVKTTLLSQGGSTVSAFVNVQFGNRTTSINRSRETRFAILLGVKGSFEFQLTPSTATQGQSTAQLVVYTEGAGKGKEEIVELPPLPLQKWVYVSILRDGRRFDVMYDDPIVGSHRMDYYPIPTANYLTIGSSHFMGSAIHIFAEGYRLTPNQISQQRALYADMTGRPPIKFPLPFLPIPFGYMQTQCIPGLPCKAVSAPPTNRLKEWKSIYN